MDTIIGCSYLEYYLDDTFGRTNPRLGSAAAPDLQSPSHSCPVGSEEGLFKVLLVAFCRGYASISE
jgi:hypothetical protein